MRNLILLISVFFISCASAKNFTFQYWYENAWHNASTILALPLQYGEDIKLRVKEERYKTCDVYFRSGDDDHRTDCNGDDYAMIYNRHLQDSKNHLL